MKVFLKQKSASSKSSLASMSSRGVICAALIYSLGMYSCADTELKGGKATQGARTSNIDKNGNPVVEGTDTTGGTVGGTIDSSETVDVGSSSGSSSGNNPIGGLGSSSGSSSGNNPTGSLGSSSGNTGGVTPVNYNLVVNMGSAANKVIITKDGGSPIECTSSCTRSFVSGSAIRISAVSNAPAEVAAVRVLQSWDGGCALTGGANGECSLTLNGNVTIQPVFRDVGSYGVGMTASLGHVLRNSAHIRFLNRHPLPSLPPSPPCPNGSLNHCDAVFMVNDNASRTRTCKDVLPGSTVGTFAGGRPDYDGWYIYTNLFIAQFNGSSWDRLCNGGADCYNKRASLEFLGSLTCVRDVR